MYRFNSKKNPKEEGSLTSSSKLVMICGFGRVKHACSKGPCDVSPVILQALEQALAKGI
jgi:hypothetical protein